MPLQLVRPTSKCTPIQTQIPGCQQAYCKFEVVAGEDWQILDGMDNGITQVARQSTGLCLCLWVSDFAH